MLFYIRNYCGIFHLVYLDTDCTIPVARCLIYDALYSRIPITRTLANSNHALRGGRNRIGRREKLPKNSREEGEIGGKSREEGEKEKLGVGKIELDGPG